MARTKVVRPPRQALATFGTTNVHYYLVTEAAYSALSGGPPDTVIREGRVIAERPRVVTPYYLLRLQGFGDNARRYLETVAEREGAHSPGLLYSYRNEHLQMNIVSEQQETVIANIEREIDRAEDPLSAVISGVDEMWDLSLMLFIYGMTAASTMSNAADLGRRRLLDVDAAGVPAEARATIERLFVQVRTGEADTSALQSELRRWSLWDEYEDRFLALFRKGR